MEVNMSKAGLPKAAQRIAIQMARSRRVNAPIAAAGDLPDELGTRLRSAHPQLIVRVENTGDLEFETTPYIGRFRGWDELIDEGYDPDGSTLGPVYWRRIRRANETLYCSAFLVTREQVIRTWGQKGLACCDPTTRVAVALMETVIPEPDDAK
jgi:hypothetical protein